MFYVKPYSGVYCPPLKGHLTQMVTLYGGGFQPAAINKKRRQNGRSIAALFGPAAIDLQRHRNSDGKNHRISTRRYRSSGPLMGFWPAAIVQFFFFVVYIIIYVQHFLKPSYIKYYNIISTSCIARASKRVLI